MYTPYLATQHSIHFNSSTTFVSSSTLVDHQQLNLTMVRRLRTNSETDSGSCPIRTTSKKKLLASVAALMDIASRMSNKLKAKNATSSSSLKKPKELMATISNKAITMMHKKKPKQLMATISHKANTMLNRKKGGRGYDGDDVTPRRSKAEEDEWGAGGVWQRSILMGDKCEPLDFSGVIYYDSKGQQMTGVPLRSSRASPMPGYLERDKKI